MRSAGTGPDGDDYAADFAAQVAAKLLGMAVFAVHDARRGPGEDGPRMVTIRLLETNDPILDDEPPGRFVERPAGTE